MKGVAVFTMKGCPHCQVFKKMLTEENILFLEYDINEEPEAFDYFVRTTEIDYIPAFMLYNEESDEDKILCYAPTKDFNHLNEGVKIIKDFL
jgi:glutaredoxin